VLSRGGLPIRPIRTSFSADYPSFLIIFTLFHLLIATQLMSPRTDVTNDRKLIFARQSRRNPSADRHLLPRSFQSLLHQVMDTLSFSHH
jgi:hypothetical protein